MLRRFQVQHPGCVVLVLSLCAMAAGLLRLVLMLHIMLVTYAYAGVEEPVAGWRLGPAELADHDGCWTSGSHCRCAIR